MLTRISVPSAYVAVVPLALGLSACGLGLSGDAALLLEPPPPALDGGSGVAITGGGPGSCPIADAGGAPCDGPDAAPRSAADGAPLVAPIDASPVVAVDDAAGTVADASPDADGGGTLADASTPELIDAGPFPPLIGEWTFDEGGGTDSADLSGYGHPVHLFGGATWAPGKSGTGLALDGLTGYGDTGLALIDTTQSFSVMCWVELALVNSWQMAITEADTHGSLFGLKLRGDETNTFDFDVETSDHLSPGYVVAASKHTAQPNVWVNLLGVYDATGPGTLRMYVNGAPESSAVVGQPLLPAAGHFVIGRALYNDAWGAYVHGTIDDVFVFAGALTDAQAALVFAAQK